jgi:pyruvate,water dikinase
VLENGPADVKLTVSLRDLSRTDTACAGGKAATLGELSRAGFPVPDGFVVTTAAFERFLTHNALSSRYTRAQIEVAVLPDDVAAAIQAGAVPFTANGAPLAVRSSSVAEDLAAASFAGQYATVLGVRGVSALPEAVRRCWISAFSSEVAAYRVARAGSSAGPAEACAPSAGTAPSGHHARGRQCHAR